MYNTDIPNRADLPTTAQLLRSTVIAILTASALLVTVVLPAEYAIDPTGIGKALGLTEMGEIKQQLALEAEADAQRGGETPLKTEDTLVADFDRSTVIEGESVPVETSPDGPAWRDEVTLTLDPGEAAEIKLAMNKGETVFYKWSVDQGHLNSALHGDGKSGESTNYRKGRAETGDAGELTASSDGSHGWFWRNRSDVPVEMTLRIKGEYSSVKRVP